MFDYDKVNGEKFDQCVLKIIEVIKEYGSLEPTQMVKHYPFKTIKGKEIEQSARRIITCCSSIISYK